MKRIYPNDVPAIFLAYCEIKHTSTLCPLFSAMTNLFYLENYPPSSSVYWALISSNARASLQQGDSNVIAQIIQLAADLWQVSADDITGATRLESVSEARTAVASVAVKRLGYSVTEVGKRLGRRHYSTIYIACRRAAAFSACSLAFRSRLEKLESAANSVLMASNSTLLPKTRQPDLKAATARVTAALIGLQNSHPEVFRRLILAAFPEAAEMKFDRVSLPLHE